MVTKDIRNMRASLNGSIPQMGAYHTIDLQLNQKLTLAKQCWDIVALDRLGEEDV